MAPTLKAWLGGSLWIGPLQMCGPVVVAPLFSSEPGSDFVGLEQALALGAVARELPEPEVGRIIVTNPTPRPLLLLDGEEIVGAQQNRIIDGTVIVPAASERVVAVCCVEEGRWDASMRDETFRTSTQIAPASLRAVKSRTGRARGRGDQRAVWMQVHTHVEATQTWTLTQAITDVFTARREALDAFVERFERWPGQRGMVVAADSRVWAVDYVADEEAFARLFSRLLRGYALDAMCARPGTRISREEIEVALARLWACPLTREATDGPEERYRFAAEGLPVEGMATRLGGRLVALNALLPGAPQGMWGVHRLRTSETSPIEVTWLHVGPGALGITMAPGKRARAARGGHWERDLEFDWCGFGALMASIRWCACSRTTSSSSSG